MSAGIRLLLVALCVLVSSCQRNEAGEDDIVDTSLNDSATEPASEQGADNLLEETATEQFADRQRIPEAERSRAPRSERPYFEETSEPEIAPNLGPRSSSAPPVHSLFSGDDYPADAQRNNEQGTVTVDMLIGTDGRVTGCTVTGSSGSRSLDNATCRILRSRARFDPALDAQGRPTLELSHEIDNLETGRLTFTPPARSGKSSRSADWHSDPIIPNDGTAEVNTSHPEHLRSPRWSSRLAFPRSTQGPLCAYRRN